MSSLRKQYSFGLKKQYSFGPVTVTGPELDASSAWRAVIPWRCIFWGAVASAFNVVLQSPGNSCSLSWQMKTSFKLSVIVTIIGVVLLIAEIIEYSLQHGKSPRRAYYRLWAARREEKEPTASVNQNPSPKFITFVLTSATLPQIVKAMHWSGIAYSQTGIFLWICLLLMVIGPKMVRLEIESQQNELRDFTKLDYWTQAMLSVIMIQICLAICVPMVVLVAYATGYGMALFSLFWVLAALHYGIQAEIANQYRIPERKFGLLHLVWALALFVGYLMMTGADNFFRRTDKSTMRLWVAGVIQGLNIQLMILPATFLVYCLRYRSHHYARLGTPKGMQGSLSEFFAGHTLCAFLLYIFLYNSKTYGSTEYLKTPWVQQMC